MAQLIRNLADADYRIAPGIGSTDLKNFYHSPGKYDYERRSVSSDQVLINGSAGHVKILEPDTFDKHYVCINGSPRKDSKLFKDFEEANPGKIILKEPDWVPLEKMRDSVLSNKDAANLMSAGHSEVSVFWEHKGYPCKGRIDWLRPLPGQGYCHVELKTTAKDVWPIADFERQADKNFWDFQAGWYQEGLHQNGIVVTATVFIWVQNKPPYNCTVIEMDQTWVQSGRNQAKQTMDQLVQWKAQPEEERWNQHPKGIHYADKPKWSVREYAY